MAEEWKTLAYPLNKYEVSDLGRVRNKNSGIFLTPYRDKKTWSYRLYPVRGKKQVKRSAAKLVWESFIGPVPRGWFVQFKDKNRRNLALKDDRHFFSISTSRSSTSGSSPTEPRKENGCQ